MRLGSTEGIKAFVRNSDAMAILSVISVVDELRSGTLRIVDVDSLALTRDFVFVHPRPNLPGLSGSSSISPGPTADPAGIRSRFRILFPHPVPVSIFRASLRGCSLRYNLWLCRITGSCSISRQKMRSLSAKQRKSYNGFLKNTKDMLKKR